MIKQLYTSLLLCSAITLINASQSPVMPEDMFQAIVKGNFNAFQTFVTNNPALIHSVYRNSASVLPNIQLEALDNSALACAALHGRPNMTLLLINKGANPNSADTFNRTPLLRVIESGKKDLWSSPVPEKTVEIIVQQLLKAQANANAQDQQGRTALSLAVEGRLNAVSQELINAGAQVHITDNQGDTLLMKAIKSSSGARTADNTITMVNILLKAGVDKNATNKEGKTAEMIAAELRRPDIIEALKNYGKINSVIDSGKRTIKRAFKK